MLDTHKNPKTIFLVAARAVAVSLSTLGNLLLSDRDNVDGDRLEAKMLEEVLGLGVDVELATLGVLGEVQSGDLRNELILALTLLLLKLEGDTTDRATLNSLHQVGGVTSNLVAETLGSDDGDLITDALVGLEVQGQSGVVTLNDDLGGLLDGLGTNATHFGGIGLLAARHRPRHTSVGQSAARRRLSGISRLLPPFPVSPSTATPAGLIQPRTITR